jgi:hypothetical protein
MNANGGIWKKWVAGDAATKGCDQHAHTTLILCASSKA